MPHSKPITLLIADDDPDDRLLAREALIESRLANQLHFVEDGEELLDFLYQRNAYSKETAPRPGLILLDLNLRKIPVVILTTSEAEEDILRSYDLGVNSFIVKPVTFEGLVDVMRTIGLYWFEIVALPADYEPELI
jgi:CheY-like chemotaxis protein